MGERRFALVNGLRFSNLGWLESFGSGAQSDPAISSIMNRRQDFDSPGAISAQMYCQFAGQRYSRYLPAAPHGQAKELTVSPSRIVGGHVGIARGHAH